MGPKLIINQSPNLKVKQPVKRQQSVDFNHSRNASKFTLNLESVLNVKDTSQRKSKEVLEEDINETCGEITINPIPFTVLNLFILKSFND